MSQSITEPKMIVNNLFVCLFGTKVSRGVDNFSTDEVVETIPPIQIGQDFNSQQWFNFVSVFLQRD